MDSVPEKLGLAVLDMIMQGKEFACKKEFTLFEVLC